MNRVYSILQEKQVVIHPLVVQTYCIEMVRDSKYNVVVLNRKGALHQVVDPECLFGSLAFRTVPVATTIIAVSYRATVFACLLVSAKGGSPADGYFAQYL